ncbi:MAG: iron-sulfur cluster repair di-iron protein [Bacteroidales bacterium]
MANFIQNKSLGEIVREDFRTSRVFQKYGIDFCCGGATTLETACQKANIPVSVLESELEALSCEKPEQDFKTLSPSELIRLILKEHHEYVREESIPLVELANKVSRVHGLNHPELIEVASIVEEIMADMDQHQMKEERILFPFIEAMEESIQNGTPIPQSCFGDVNNPIRAMENDHDHVGEMLFRLKEITNNYELSADACQSYVMLFKRLEAFQNNTFRHVHLENNILFKKAIALQQSL